MITAVVVSAVVLLALTLVVAVALEPGPSPGEVAVAYERAVDRHDAQTLWALSGPALREGLTRRAFVETTRVSFEGTPTGVVADVEVTDEFTGTADASVLTRVTLRDSTEVTRRTRCVKHQGAWCVQSVTQRPESDEPDASDEPDVSGPGAPQSS